MKKLFFVLLTFVSVSSYAQFPNANLIDATGLSQDEVLLYFKYTVQNAALGASSSINEQIALASTIADAAQNFSERTLLELQLKALKSARIVSVKDEELRFSVAMIGTFGVGTAGVMTTLGIMNRLYGSTVMRGNPLMRASLITLTALGGSYLTVCLAQKTGRVLILTEPQLRAVIASVEGRLEKLNIAAK